MSSGNRKVHPSTLEDSRQFWRDNAQALIQESVRSLEDTAKQIIVVGGILEGLYFHAIAYSEIRNSLDANWLVLVYVLPLALWLVSLFFALLVFFPRAYSANINSWRESKTTFERLVVYKHTMLKASSIFLCLGGFALFMALGTYLAG